MTKLTNPRLSPCEPAEGYGFRYRVTAQSDLGPVELLFETELDALTWFNHISLFGKCPTSRMSEYSAHFAL
jgi:hypothetical protein